MEARKFAGEERSATSVETDETVEEALVSMKRLLGRKWHPIVVHRLLEDGSMRFSELKSDIDGISGKMLADSLDKLEAAGLIDRKIRNEKPVRVEYTLTDRGESLEPVLAEMVQWGRKHVTDLEFDSGDHSD